MEVGVKRVLVAFIVTPPLFVAIDPLVERYGKHAQSSSHGRHAD